MRRSCSIALRSVIAAAAAALTLLAAARLAAESPPPTLVRIEQDWELVVGTPDPTSDSPQVTCVISPLGDVSGLHAQLDLNQQTLPKYAPGGVQLQAWDGKVPLKDAAACSRVVLSQEGETVCWTQSMEVRDGRITFAVSNGNSTTWGSLQDGESLSFSVPTTLGDLSGYDTDVSVKNSGAGYALNRVQSLVIKKVRYIFSNGTQAEDATPKVIHQQVQ